VAATPDGSVWFSDQEGGKNALARIARGHVTAFPAPPPFTP